MKPHVRLRLLLPLALMLVLPALAFAQDLTPERVQIALDLTDRRIEQAEMLLTGADNDRAQNEVNLAVSLQAQAKTAFGGTQLAFAMRLTLEARLHADRAITILRGPDPDGVLAQLERTRELLDRARERIEECDQVRARAMIRAAFDMQARAEVAARDGRFLAALQLTMSARERAHRALRLCRMDENLQESAERALQRTDQLIERARDRIGEASEPARQALARAVDVQGRAWIEFRAGHFEASLRLTQSARAFAHRAIRLSGGGS